MGINFVFMCLCFCYVCRLPSTHNGIQKGWGVGGVKPPPLWKRPKADSIMGAGEAANIATTEANAYNKIASLWDFATF